MKRLENQTTMKQYLQILDNIQQNGIDREGRNGKTRALFALQFRHNLNDGFPAVTTKQLAFKAVKAELLWFLSGSTNDNDLKELMHTDKTIWTANAEDPKWKERAKACGMYVAEGSLGRIYGAQWRHWQCWNNAIELDQIARLIHMLRTNPTDRRLVITAWRPDELDLMALPPCHSLATQFFCQPGYCEGVTPRLSLHMVQRSCDMFLGVPFNIASYGLLLSMVAQVVGMEPFELVITFNDAHIYHAHFDQVKEQLTRTPGPLPKLVLDHNVKEIDDFKMEDITLMGYSPQPSIKAEMIV